MTNYFYVVDPQGKVHTRSSMGRTYTHTVVVRPGRAKVDRYFAKVEPTAQAAGESYDRTVDESKGIFPNREQWRGPKALQGWQDFAIKYLAEDAVYSRGRDAVIEKARAHALKIAQDYEASGSWDRYANAGWCGRPDLAQKLAAQQTGEQVVILDAKVGKPPKASNP